ncbi:MAG: hypothetical protein ACK40I_01345 [Tabrizicola sp.]
MVSHDHLVDPEALAFALADAERVFVGKAVGAQSWPRARIDATTRMRRRTCAHVEGNENLHGHEYDRITKQVKDGELIVTGERTVDERAEGLGGELTYCTLGEPIDLNRILTGEALPTFADLGTVLFNTATSQTIDLAQMDEATGCLGSAAGTKLRLIYRPDLDWLKTPQDALTLDFARTITEADKDARHIVFAPANHTSPKLLQHHRLTKVELSVS